MINHPAGPPVQPGVNAEDPSLLGEPGERAGRARGAIPGDTRSRPGRSLTNRSHPDRPRLVRYRPVRRKSPRSRSPRGRSARSRSARPLVLLAAFVCAACGLVYELELVALGGYLLGDSMTQTSVVLSVMVFAMGVGSLLAKRLTRRPAMSFALVECTLALIGGVSVLALYSCWAWLGQYRATTAGLVGMTFAIGTLIGAEIPLLMTLIQRIRREDAGRAAADLFAADYVGALIGGLAFPFLLLPAFGQAIGALLTGGVNALAGAAVVLWLFRDEPPPRARLLLWTGCGLVLVTLAVAMAFTGAIERAARHALYGAQVRFATQSRHQEIVLAGPLPDPAPRVPPQRTSEPPSDPGSPLELFLDGRLAVCGPDEYRDHEALVHPALAAGPSGRVLVLGGDGLALREVLRHAGVRSVVVVELDPALPALVRSDPALSALSEQAFDDPRVRLVTAEPLGWLRDRGPGADRSPGAPSDVSAGGPFEVPLDAPSDIPLDVPFDVIVSDLPGLGDGHGITYESEEFYGLAAGRLTPSGRLAVRTGPVGPGLWSAESGLRAAGLRTVPYEAASGQRHCRRSPKSGRTFVLAAREQPVLGLAADAPPPRSVTVDGLRASAERLAARRPTELPAPRTLLG